MVLPMIQMIHLVETVRGDTVSKRREFLDKKLGTYKHEHMKRKLPVDSQLLSCAQEELALKKNGGANG